MDSEKNSRRAAETRRSASLMRRMLLGFKGRLDHELRPKNVTTAQLRLLHELKERPGSSGAQLARACYITPQSMQVMLARAVERGWVLRGKSAENDRLLTTRLTPAGERLLSYADAVLARLEREVWVNVGLADLRMMNEILQSGLIRLED